MFQTHSYISPTGDISNSSTGLAQASFHASFRVFGTGPVTVTDVPLKSDPTILRKIAGNLSPTSTSPSAVIQASTVFTVLNEIFDRRIMEPGTGKALKVYVDKTIGIWNVQSGNGRLIEFVTPFDIAQALGLSSNSLPTVLLHIQSSNPENERVVLHDLSNVLHPAPPIRIELDPLGWATVSVAVVESVGTAGKVACPGLVDKYLSSRGISEARVDSDEKTGWTFMAMSRCSGTLGLWIAPSLFPKSIRVSLIGESGTVDAAQDSKSETLDLGKGKGRWITLGLKGRSKVAVELSNC